MPNWIVIAERLRTVKQAREQYLMRAIVDMMMIGPMLDRLAADLGLSAPSRGKSEARERFGRHQR